MHEQDWSGWGKGQVAGFCEHGNEPSSYIKWGNFLTSWGPVKFTRRALRDVASYELHLHEFTNRQETDEQQKLRRRVYSLFCVVVKEIWRHSLYRDDDDVLRNPCRPTGCRPNCSLSCVNNKLRKAINLIYLPDRMEYSTTCQFSTVTSLWKQWQGRKASCASSGRLIAVTLHDSHGTRLHCVTVQFVCS
jgi:hypothetical protein